MAIKEYIKNSHKPENVREYYINNHPHWPGLNPYIKFTPGIHSIYVGATGEMFPASTNYKEVLAPADINNPVYLKDILCENGELLFDGDITKFYIVADPEISGRFFINGANIGNIATNQDSPNIMVLDEEAANKYEPRRYATEHSIKKSILHANIKYTYYDVTNTLQSGTVSSGTKALNDPYPWWGTTINWQSIPAVGYEFTGAESTYKGSIIAGTGAAVIEPTTSPTAKSYSVYKNATNGATITVNNTGTFDSALSISIGGLKSSSWLKSASITGPETTLNYGNNSYTMTGTYYTDITVNAEGNLMNLYNAASSATGVTITYPNYGEAIVIRGDSTWNTSSDKFQFKLNEGYNFPITLTIKDNSTGTDYSKLSITAAECDYNSSTGVYTLKTPAEIINTSYVENTQIYTIAATRITWSPTITLGTGVAKFVYSIDGTTWSSTEYTSGAGIVIDYADTCYVKASTASSGYVLENQSYATCTYSSQSVTVPKAAKFTVNVTRATGVATYSYSTNDGTSYTNGVTAASFTCPTGNTAKVKPYTASNKYTVDTTTVQLTATTPASITLVPATVPFYMDHRFEGTVFETTGPYSVAYNGTIEASDYIELTEFETPAYWYYNGSNTIVSGVKSEMIINIDWATRKVHTYTITWKYLSAYPSTWTTTTETYNYNATPSRTGSNVTNSADNAREYFLQWDSLSNVTSDRTITGQYKRQYKLTFSGTRCTTDTKYLSGWYDNSETAFTYTWTAGTSSDRTNYAFNSDGTQKTATQSITPNQAGTYSKSADYIYVKINSTNSTASIGGTAIDDGWRWARYDIQCTWTAATNYAYSNSGLSTSSINLTEAGKDAYDSAPTHGYYIVSTDANKYTANSATGWYEVTDSKTTRFTAKNDWSFNGSSANDYIDRSSAVPGGVSVTPNYAKITVAGSNDTIYVGSTQRDSNWSGVVALNTTIRWVPNPYYSFTAGTTQTEASSTVTAPATYANTPTCIKAASITGSYCDSISKNANTYYASNNLTITWTADNNHSFNGSAVSDTSTATLTAGGTFAKTPSYVQINVESARCKANDGTKDISSGWIGLVSNGTRITWTADTGYSFADGTTQSATIYKDVSLDSPYLYKGSADYKYVTFSGTSCTAYFDSETSARDGYRLLGRSFFWKADNNYAFDNTGKDTLNSNIVVGTTNYNGSANFMNITIGGTRCESNIPSGFHEIGATLSWDANNNCAFNSTGTQTTTSLTVERDVFNYEPTANYIYVNISAGTGCTTPSTTGWYQYNTKCTWTRDAGYAFDASGTTQASDYLTTPGGSYSKTPTHCYLTIDIDNTKCTCDKSSAWYKITDATSVIAKFTPKPNYSFSAGTTATTYTAPAVVMNQPRTVSASPTNVLGKITYTNCQVSNSIPSDTNYYFTNNGTITCTATDGYAYTTTATTEQKTWTLGCALTSDPGYVKVSLDLTNCVYASGHANNQYVAKETNVSTVVNANNYWSFTSGATSSASTRPAGGASKTLTSSNVQAPVTLKASPSYCFGKISYIYTIYQTNQYDHNGHAESGYWVPGDFTVYASNGYAWNSAGTTSTKVYSWYANCDITAKADYFSASVSATHCKSTYLSTSSSATSGSPNYTYFGIDNTVYAFATLKDNTAQYYYTPKDTWTLITGRTYRVGSVTAASPSISVAANSNIASYTIKISAGANSKITSCSSNLTIASDKSYAAGTVDYGAEVSATATANSGYAYDADGTSTNSYSATVGDTITTTIAAPNYLAYTIKGVSRTNKTSDSIKYAQSGSTISHTWTTSQTYYAFDNSGTKTASDSKTLNATGMSLSVAAPGWYYYGTWPGVANTTHTTDTTVGWKNTDTYTVTYTAASGYAYSSSGTSTATSTANPGNNFTGKAPTHLAYTVKGVTRTTKTSDSTEYDLIGATISYEWTTSQTYYAFDSNGTRKASNSKTLNSTGISLSVNAPGWYYYGTKPAATHTTHTTASTIGWQNTSTYTVTYTAASGYAYDATGKTTATNTANPGNNFIAQIPGYILYTTAGVARTDHLSNTTAYTEIGSSVSFKWTTSQTYYAFDSSGTRTASASATVSDLGVVLSVAEPGWYYYGTWPAATYTTHTTNTTIGWQSTSTYTVTYEAITNYAYASSGTKEAYSTANPGEDFTAKVPGYGYLTVTIEHCDVIENGSGWYTLSKDIVTTYRASSDWSFSGSTLKDTTTTTTTVPNSVSASPGYCNVTINATNSKAKIGTTDVSDTTAIRALNTSITWTPNTYYSFSAGTDQTNTTATISGPGTYSKSPTNYRAASIASSSYCTPNRDINTYYASGTTITWTAGSNYSFGGAKTGDTTTPSTTITAGASMAAPTPGYMKASYSGTNVSKIYRVVGSGIEETMDNSGIYPVGTTIYWRASTATNTQYSFTNSSATSPTTSTSETLALNKLTYTHNASYIYYNVTITKNTDTASANYSSGYLLNGTTVTFTATENTTTKRYSYSNSTSATHTVGYSVSSAGQSISSPTVYIWWYVKISATNSIAHLGSATGTAITSGSSAWYINNQSITWTPANNYSFAEHSSTAQNTSATITSATALSKSPGYGYVTVTKVRCDGISTGYRAIGNTTFTANSNCAYNAAGTATTEVKSVSAGGSIESSANYIKVTVNGSYCSGSPYTLSSTAQWVAYNAAQTWTPNTYYSYDGGTTQTSKTVNLVTPGGNYAYSPGYAKVASIATGAYNASVNRNNSTYYALGTSITWTAGSNYSYNGSSTGDTYTPGTTATSITAGANISAPNPNYVKATLGGKNIGSITWNPGGATVETAVSGNLFPVSATIVWNAATATNTKYAFVNTGATWSSSYSTTTEQIALGKTSYTHDANYVYYNVTINKGTNTASSNYASGYLLNGTTITFTTTAATSTKRYSYSSSSSTVNTENKTVSSAGQSITSDSVYIWMNCTCEGTNCSATSGWYRVGTNITWTGNTGTNYKYSFTNTPVRNPSDAQRQTTSAVVEDTTSYAKTASYVYYNVNIAPATNCTANYTSGWGYFLNGTTIKFTATTATDAVRYSFSTSSSTSYEVTSQVSSSVAGGNIASGTVYIWRYCTIGAKYSSTVLASQKQWYRDSTTCSSASYYNADSYTDPRTTSEYNKKYYYTGKTTNSITVSSSATEVYTIYSTQNKTKYTVSFTKASGSYGSWSVASISAAWDAAISRSGDTITVGSSTSTYSGYTATGYTTTVAYTNDSGTVGTANKTITATTTRTGNTYTLTSTNNHCVVKYYSDSGYTNQITQARYGSTIYVTVNPDSYYYWDIKANAHGNDYTAGGYTVTGTISGSNINIGTFTASPFSYTYSATSANGVCTPGTTSAVTYGSNTSMSINPNARYYYSSTSYYHGVPYTYSNRPLTTANYTFSTSTADGTATATYVSACTAITYTYSISSANSAYCYHGKTQPSSANTTAQTGTYANRASTYVYYRINPTSRYEINYNNQRGYNGSPIGDTNHYAVGSNFTFTDSNRTATLAINCTPITYTVTASLGNAGVQVGVSTNVYNTSLSKTYAELYTSNPSIYVKVTPNSHYGMTVGGTWYYNGNPLTGSSYYVKGNTFTFTDSNKTATCALSTSTYPVAAIAYTASVSASNSDCTLGTASGSYSATISLTYQSATIYLRQDPWKHYDVTYGSTRYYYDHNYTTSVNYTAFSFSDANKTATYALTGCSETTYTWTVSSTNSNYVYYNTTSNPSSAATISKKYSDNPTIYYKINAADYYYCHSASYPKGTPYSSSVTRSSFSFSYANKTAIFKKNCASFTYTCKPTTVTGGTVSWSPATITAGGSSSWTITANTGYNTPSTYQGSVAWANFTKSTTTSNGDATASNLPNCTRKSFTITLAGPNYGAWRTTNSTSGTAVTSQTAYYGDIITSSGNTLTCYRWDATSTARWTVYAVAPDTTAQYSYSTPTISGTSSDPITGSKTITAANTRTTRTYTVTIKKGGTTAAISSGTYQVDNGSATTISWGNAFTVKYGSYVKNVSATASASSPAISSLTAPTVAQSTGDYSGTKVRVTNNNSLQVTCYYGTSSGSTTNSTTISASSSKEITGLTAGTTYYFFFRVVKTNYSISSYDPSAASGSTGVQITGTTTITVNGSSSTQNINSSNVSCQPVAKKVPLHMEYYYEGVKLFTDTYNNYDYNSFVDTTVLLIPSYKSGAYEYGDPRHNNPSQTEIDPLTTETTVVINYTIRTTAYYNITVQAKYNGSVFTSQTVSATYNSSISSTSYYGTSYDYGGYSYTGGSGQSITVTGDATIATTYSTQSYRSYTLNQGTHTNCTFSSTTGSYNTAKSLSFSPAPGYGYPITYSVGTSSGGTNLKGNTQITSGTGTYTMSGTYYSTVYVNCTATAKTYNITAGTLSGVSFSSTTGTYGTQKTIAISLQSSYGYPVSWSLKSGSTTVASGTLNSSTDSIKYTMNSTYYSSLSLNATATSTAFSWISYGDVGSWGAAWDMMQDMTLASAPAYYRISREWVSEALTYDLYRANLDLSAASADAFNSWLESEGYFWADTISTRSTFIATCTDMSDASYTNFAFILENGTGNDKIRVFLRK